MRPRPDDEKAESPILYVLFGLLSLVLVAGALAFLFLPPALAAGLVIRGSRAGRPLLVWIGGGLFLVWFALFYRVGKRITSARRSDGDQG